MDWKHLNAIVSIKVLDEEPVLNIHEIYQEVTNASILDIELPSGEFKETKILSFFGEHGWECYSVYMPTPKDFEFAKKWGSFPKAIFRFKRPKRLF